MSVFSDRLFFNSVYTSSLNNQLKMKFGKPGNSLRPRSGRGVGCRRFARNRICDRHISCTFFAMLNSFLTRRHTFFQSCLVSSDAPGTIHLYRRLPIHALNVTPRALAVIYAVMKHYNTASCKVKLQLSSRGYCGGVDVMTHTLAAQQLRANR